MAKQLEHGDVTGDPAAIADLAEQVRDRAAGRAADKAKTSALDDAMSRGTHLVVTDETEGDAKSAAEWFEKHQTTVQVRMSEEIAQQEKDYVFFLACPQGHQGIHFTCAPLDPTGDTTREVGMNDWVATYRRRGQQHDGLIVCQECRAQGTETILHYEDVDRRNGTFRPSPRWTMKIARDPERFRKEGGAWRACNLMTESSNIRKKALEATMAGGLTNG